MPNQVHGVLLHTMSGSELFHVRTELRLLLPERINQRLLASRGAGIVIQSSEIATNGARRMSGYATTLSNEVS